MTNNVSSFYIKTQEALIGVYLVKRILFVITVFGVYLVIVL